MASTAPKNQKEIKNDYVQFIEKLAPKTSLWRSMLIAFIVGGLVCCLGQLLFDLFNKIPSLSEENARAWSTVSLCFLAILLTGFGVFDDIARYTGAGTFLPITGFANAVASAALEFKSEGLIFGLGTKMFNVAGPVIVNGVVWSVVAGIVHYIISLVIT